MIVCENRPRHPPDRTLRAGRRSRHRAAGPPAGTAQAAVRRRVGMPRGRASAARRAQRASRLRLCYGRLGHLFPYRPKQPGYHKRLKAAAPLLCKTMLHLARLCPSWADDLRLLDGTPVPCGTSRTTAKRSELAGWANYGYCAAHSRYYWGLKLYLITTAEGMPVARCLADPKIGEREVAEERFGHARDLQALRDGMVVLADKGLSGKDLERFCADQIPVLLARPDRKDEKKRRFGKLGGMRQWIEAIYDTCKDQLDLERHGGRTPSGVIARVAQRLLALAAVIWHNWKIDAPVKRSLIATTTDRIRNH